MFLVGHVYDQLVAEISIPRPVISLRQSLDDLSVSERLLPFCDVTDGLRAAIPTDQSQPYRVCGRQVGGHALHWTLFHY